MLGDCPVSPQSSAPALGGLTGGEEQPSTGVRTTKPLPSGEREVTQRGGGAANKAGVSSRGELGCFFGWARLAQTARARAGAVPIGGERRGRHCRSPRGRAQAPGLAKQESRRG